MTVPDEVLEAAARAMGGFVDTEPAWLGKAPSLLAALDVIEQAGYAIVEDKINRTEEAA